MGVVRLARFIWRALPLMGVKEGERDEYLVSNLAVLPEYQRQGIGGHLLSCAEERASELGFPRVALTVGVGNRRAIEFYKGRGYRIIARVEIGALRKRTGYPGFYRAVKVV